MRHYLIIPHRIHDAYTTERHPEEQSDGSSNVEEECNPEVGHHRKQDRCRGDYRNDKSAHARKQVLFY